MKVIAFAHRPLLQDGTWQSSELDKMQASFACELAKGEASGWHIAATEVGDPQFYLLGPPPEENCMLSISRLGRLYILEDGTGRVLFECTRLESLIQQAKSFLRGTRAGIVASAVMMWAAVRHHFEEKVEPFLAEGEEFLIHVAPKLAAFA